MANELTTQGGLGNVFITGATSAVGLAAVRTFAAAGYHVFGSTLGTAAEARQLRAIGAIPTFADLQRAGEVRSAIEAAQADLVINLAPQAANHAIGNSQWNADQIALLTHGTQALMEAATAAKVKFVVHTSYTFAGGHDAPAQAIIDAALTGEQLVLGCSTPACVLRFGFLYGAEQPELATLRDTLRMGRSFSGGSSHAHCSWVTIHDAVRATLLAAQKQPAQAVIAITDGSPAAPLDFFKYFSQAQGLTMPNAGQPFSLNSLLFGTKPLDISMVHMDATPTETEASDTLGWAPRFASFRQGIDDILLTWRAQAGAVQA